MNEDELRSRLSALPSPPMPDDVHSAISAALASEAQARPTGGEVVALTPRHQRRLSGLLIAAAVAGVLMLLAVTVQSPTPPGGTQSPVVRAGAIYAPEDFAQQLTQRFLSAPAAVVIVTSYPAHSEYEEVWVVNPGCGTGDVRVIRHMVYDVDESTASL